MKLQTSNDFDVQVVGSNTSSSFSIAMNGKAFRVLSSTLYQNKIGSIVREISCNAVDGHTMAGKKDQPFDIHLPDIFEPWFSVRDYGVGMSRDTIKNVFTKYFESTKDQSNDTIGAFGLGAKTPFSYTDQFTVTSVVAGEKVVYSAYILNDLPQIDEMHSEATEEPQGVEIKISVKREDYLKFAQEVRDQLNYFTVKPNVVNGKVTWNSPNLLKESDIFNLYKGEYGNRKIVILQGNVGYTLDTTHMKDIDSTLVNFIRAVESNYLLTVSFPIGSIGVTASREGVEYDSNTVSSIVERLKKVRSIMGKEVKDKLDVSTSEFEWNTIYCSLPGIESSLVDLNDYPNYQVNRWVEIGQVFDKSNTVQISNAVRKTLKYINGHYTIDVLTAKNIVVLLKDTSNRLQKRVDKLKDEGAYSVIVIGNTDGEMSEADCVAMKAKFIACTKGFNNIRKVSEVELPLADKKKYSRTGPTVKFILLDTDGSIQRVTDPISSIEGAFIYQEVDRLSIDNLSLERIKNIREMQEELNDEKILPVVIVNAKGLVNINKLPNEKYELQQYVDNYCKTFDRSSLKRKYIAIRAKAYGISKVSREALTFLYNLEDQTAVKDKNVYEASFFIKKYINARIGSELSKAARLMGWDSCFEVAQIVDKSAEAIRDKIHNTAMKNTVVKWYITEPYAASKLPLQDMKDMMVIYAERKNCV